MNKTILITGASTGIGRDTAVYFARNGWNVLATMRHLEKATDLNDLPNVKVMALDVMQPEQVQKVVEEGIAAFGKIDVILNNAAYYVAGAFEALSEAEVRRHFEVNYFGALTLIKAVLPHFRKQKSGMIMTITSIGGFMGFPLFTSYNATKWALEGFMESLHYELRAHNIKVCTIQPGPLKTGFETTLRFKTSEGYETYTERVERNTRKVFASSDSGELVARKIFKIAQGKGSRLRYRVGRIAHLLYWMRRLLPLSRFMNAYRQQVEKEQ